MAFDITPTLRAASKCDSMQMPDDRSLINYQTDDGHVLPFMKDSFGHVLCYDTVYNIDDYEKVFSEFCRVLQPAGRTVFVDQAHGIRNPPKQSNF
jgi:ubiquinone/menaquinone biosynthesis C-methylase UbiE